MPADHLDGIGITGGLPLDEWYPGWDHRMLLTTTDQTRQEDIDALVNGLHQWIEVIA